jgi:hypothetical protein
MAAVEAQQPRPALKAITTDRPEPGVNFTATELQRISDAADALQAAVTKRDEVEAAVARAKGEASYFRAVEPSQDLADALAYLGRQPLPELPVIGSPDAAAAKRALPGLKALLQQQDEQIARLRGQLRVAVADACRAARKREAALFCQAVEMLADHAAAMDALDARLAVWANDGRLDDGIWRMQNVVLAPAQGLLPTHARVESMNYRDTLWSPLSTAHTDAARNLAAGVEAELRAAIGNRPWPF